MTWKEDVRGSPQLLSHQGRTPYSLIELAIPSDSGDISQQTQSWARRQVVDGAVDTVPDSD